MNRLSGTLSCLLCCLSLAAQTPKQIPPSPVPKSLMGLDVTPNNDAVQLVNGVFRNGTCFETYDPSTTGDAQQIGVFTNGQSSLGMQDGIILSTGLVEAAEGPNQQSFTLHEYNLQYTDPDIAAIAGNNTIYDIAVLEFDFRPTSDEISFEYVFASEEYCEIVSPGFNDVFAFFISGPGIDGPYAGGAENIARIPNSDQIVSVSSINHFTNSIYYRNNTPASFGDACSNGNAIAPDEIEFDGFTSVLTASSPVIPCQTYHLKIVVADIGDDIYDSAIFLNAGSFAAGLVSVSQENLGTFETNDQLLVEGCGRSQLIFSRTIPDLSNDLWVRYFVSPLSTAEEGADFATLPDSFLIEAGKMTDTLVLESIPDGIAEEDETVFLFVENSCDCQGAFIELGITDAPVLATDLAASVAYCTADSTLIGPTVNGGVAPYSYAWSDASSDSTLLLDQNSATGEYGITVTDACGQTQTETLVVEPKAVSATVSGTYATCDDGQQVPIVLSGATVYDVVFTRNGTTETVAGFTGDTLWLSPNGTESISLVSVTGDSCPGQASGTAEIISNEISIDSLVTDVSCFGQADGQIRLEIGTAPAPYTYTWSVPSLAGNEVQNLAAGDYSVTISDALDCQYVYDFELQQPAAPIELATEQITDLDCTQPAQMLLSADGGNGGYTYAWSDGSNTPDRQFTDPGTFTVSVTDMLGCSTSREITITDERDPPTAELSGNYTLDCMNPIAGILPTEINSTWTYRWIDAQGDTIGIEPSIDLAQAGAYRLLITDPANGCTAESSFTVTDDTERLDLSITQPEPFSCRLTTTTVTAQFVDPPSDLELSWSTENGSLGSPEQNPITVASDAGSTLYLDSYSPSRGCRQQDTFVLIFDTLSPNPDLSYATPISCAVTASTLSVENPSSDWQYAWQSPNGSMIGDTIQATVQAERPGDYSVLVTDTSNGCASSLTLSLPADFSLPVAQAGADRSLSCLSPTTELSGSAEPIGLEHQYRWLDSAGNELAPTALFPAREAGMYILEVRHATSGCLDRDTVTLDNNGPTSLRFEVESAPCTEVGNAIQVLEVAGGTAPYRFRLGEQGSFTDQREWTQVAAGPQIVGVQDANGCTLSESITVVPAYDLLEVVVSPVNVLFGESMPIEVQVNRAEEDILSYSWTAPDSLLSCTTCAEPILREAQASTRLQLTVVDRNGCQVTVIVPVTVDRSRTVYLPTAFSPLSRQDANRYFGVFGSERIVDRILNLQIFSRWGSLVFDSQNTRLNDPASGWDGRIGSELAPSGVYLYRTEILLRDGRTIQQTGHFTLIR